MLGCCCCCSLLSCYFFFFFLNHLPFSYIAVVCLRTSVLYKNTLQILKSCFDFRGFCILVELSACFYRWFWNVWEIRALVGRASSVQREDQSSSSDSTAPGRPLRFLLPSSFGPPSLVQVQHLFTYNVHGGGGFDGAACRPRVHKHVGYFIPKVDLAVGCDGFVLH